MRDQAFAQACNALVTAASSAPVAGAGVLGSAATASTAFGTGRSASVSAARKVLGAPVVDVDLLLHLGGVGAPAQAAGDEAAVGEGVLAGPGVGVAVETRLHALEQLPADELRVAAHVELAAPVELARVERVPQHRVDGRGAQGRRALELATRIVAAM